MPAGPGTFPASPLPGAYGSVCRQHILQGMGGTIAVESQLGEGTFFTIRLPRAAVAQANGAKHNGTPVHAEERAIVGAGR